MSATTTTARKVGNSSGIRQAQPLGERREADRKKGTKGKRSLEGQDNKHDLSEEAIMVKAEVEGYLVCEIQMDEGASIEVMYGHCFNMLHPSIRARLTKTQIIVSGFSGDQVKPLGKIELDVCFGGDDMCRRAIMKFTVIPAPLPYNIILVTPISQKRRVFFLEKSQVVTQEVAEWLKARIIGRNLEAYVDDMVMKIEKEMIADVAETFDNLRRINMKLNRKNVHLE
ncbi:hypothetical protein Tco_0565840 [Tanacetum coccineum]